MEAINEGRLGPVLKRWINASVVPVADILRACAASYLNGNKDDCATFLHSPLFGLAEFGAPGALNPIMEWCLRGSSQGRGDETTYADDLALVGLATAITKIAATRHTSDGHASQGFTVNAVLDQMADALRETVTGQFITSVQGAGAMMRVRQENKDAWRQGRSLSRIVGMMKAQVRPQLEQQELDAGEVPIDGKRILKVMSTDGELRRIELKRTPDTVDWQVLLMAWDGEKNRHRPMWLAFALMILCAAQKEAGWFDITTRAKNTPQLSAITDRGSKRHRSKTKVLVLSDAAQEAISKDVDKWVGCGFYFEPMVCKPEDNDYLTVKHRPFQGRRGPRGLNSESSAMATTAGRVLAESPWQVNRLMLEWLRNNPQAVDMAQKDMGTIPAELCLAAYRRDAQEPELYLPTSMDFRGRLYYRPTWVNPQQGSLNKALLQFAPQSHPFNDVTSAHEAVAMYCSELMGYGKWRTANRIMVYNRWVQSDYAFREDADDPLVLQACGLLLKAQRMDQIPVQLDGTCNGLQHLSALTRDLVGAKSVNLTKTDKETSTPADIYGEVADLMTRKFETMVVGFPMDSSCPAPGWVRRLALSGVQFDRKLCKRPVMVLPFGGTLAAVQEALKAGLLEQLDADPMKARLWTLCEMPDAVEGNYSAFKDRELVHHPLFNKDCQHLGQLLWGCITQTIPKAMEAMRTFKGIATKIGERGIRWQTPSGLWVMQAKSKADRRQVAMRGFHLPNSVRRLTLLTDRDEVDGRYHSQGIVANFIHSMDAAHLATTLETWYMSGPTRDQPIGAIHDCVLTRPSQVSILGYELRRNFFGMYRNDPLRLPVELIDPSPLGEDLEQFDSWYSLAEHCGVSFPEFGRWQPEEVLGSAWFFA